VTWAADIIGDLRLGGRLARRSPWFAMTAIIVLATGIGASVAVYTVLREVLFRPLPYADPDWPASPFCNSSSLPARRCSPRCR
jgi:putative ABC transport system permease protein